MKKPLLLAAVASLGLLQAHAQQTSNLLFPNREQSRSHKVALRLLQHQSGATAQKPTTTKQRVIGQALNPVIGFDSTRFAYTGTNGSAYDFNNGEYNYNNYFTSAYAPMFLYPNEGTSTRILADSIINYDEDGAYSLSKAFYRTDKKIDSIWSYSLGGSVPVRSKIINVYNPQGYLTASYDMQQNTPPNWDTFYYAHYSYNSTFTQMNRDSTWVGFPSPSLREENIYYYSAGNKLDSIINWDLQGPSPERNYSYNMTYNGAGKLVTLRDYGFDSGIRVLSTLDSIGYTSGVDYFTYFESTEYENDTIAYASRERKFVTAGLVDSVLANEKEGQSAPWSDNGKLKFTYNTFNNPVKLTVSMMGLPQEIEAYHFYYETYDDGTSSIKPIAENKDFSIYPNPFQNNIAIDWKGKQQSAVSVRMMNILGQEVYSTSMKLNSGRNALDLPSLNNGNYILVITDAQGKSWSSKMVKK